ncbi:MAG: DUF4344 domain-containing metallopeptidase [Paracoccaceae bacterium]
MRSLILPTLLAASLAPPALAFTFPEDEATARFVQSNVIAIFYHELGHALIDVLALPVLGREEDAADTLSTLLINSIWEEDAAVAMVYDTATAFLLYSDEAEKSGRETAYWGQHSLDLQRYYNLACLFYGANPDEREDVARELDLPKNRAELCPDEFQLADESWGALLGDLTPTAGSKGLRIVNADLKDPLVALVAEEVRALNEVYALPVWVDVRIEPCGEANAYYYPDDKSITVCTEYADDLVRLWRENP